ncbi:MAG: cupin domain-containing protein [Deltaproteobacteria bacterium]|nr:cupin domain-containing protein [Deltaproteobacteria bacterium]
MIVTRADGGVWEETGVQGVRVKRLSVDKQKDQFTALVRMEAGSSYPRHIHNGAEECLVLEGELRVGPEVLRAGDYQRAPAGSRHGVQSTDNGCLLLIVSSLSDEMY